jgi:acyl-CoA thioesterase
MLEYTEEIWKISPFVKLLGLEIEKLEQGVCFSRLRIKDTLLNKHSVVHGGVIYSMADISMGVAVYSTLKNKEETSTVEIKINYLKPAKTSVLTCEARIVKKGKNIGVLEAEVRSGESDLIAKALGTFMLT